MKCHKNIKFIFFLIGSFCFISSLTSCSLKFISLKYKSNHLYQLDSTIKADNNTLKLYQPYKLKLDSVMNDVVAISDIEITKKLPEGPLNNLFADAMYVMGKKYNLSFDIAYTNYDGLRMPLPKGNIYRYLIFELMPFENTLVSLTINGQKTQQFFDAIAADRGSCISGASFIIKDKKATNILIGGKAIDLNKNYSILTSDYIANGGDIGTVFNKPIKKIDTEILLRDAILNYLQIEKNANRNLNPKSDGRIKVE